MTRPPNRLPRSPGAARPAEDEQRHVVIKQVRRHEQRRHARHRPNAALVHLHPLPVPCPRTHRASVAAGEPPRRRPSRARRLRRRASPGAIDQKSGITLAIRERAAPIRSDTRYSCGE